MNRSEHFDPPLETPAAIRVARPLIARFVRSAECPPVHRWHARTTLPVLALFVAMSSETTSDSARWADLSPDALLRTILEAAPEEHAFLRDLLDLSASFCAFLGREGLLPEARASELRQALAQLALGLSSR